MPAVPIPRENLSFLELKRTSEGEFAASLEDFFGEAQPGDLLARIALAGAAVASGRELRALHATFVETAAPAIPLTLRASQLGSDDRFSHCEVRVSGARLLCVANASFEAPAVGLSYQDGSLAADLPDPDALPSTLEYARREGWPEDYARGPFEFRRVGPLRPPPGASTALVCWLRTRQPLPADDLHTAALVFASAFYPHWEFERRIGERFDYSRFRLLAHALRIQRRVRFDDWWLMRGQSFVASDGRALAHRELFARDGRLLASSTLEAAVASS